MILVVGSTGSVGSQITRTLLDEGRDVRILVRPDSPYQPLADAGAELAFGDLKDPPTLPPALARVDTVITTATAGSRGGADTPETVDLAGNRSLIDAARQAGVRQLIFTSTIAADEASPVPILSAKAATEAYLRDSGVTFTSLASDAIADLLLPLVVGGPALAGHPVTVVGGGWRRHSFIAARDFAAFAVASVGHPDAVNRRVVIGGPEALSLRDVIAIYERVLGHPIPVQTIDPGELLPSLPPVPGLAEVVSGMVAALDMFDSPIDMSETAPAFGVQLTPIADLVSENVTRSVSGSAVWGGRQ
jgi:NADH dehydrogenase